MEKNEIYKCRMSIDDFGVDKKNSLNNAIFDILFQISYVSKRSNMEETILGIFNDAYYICTLILLEKRPYFKIKYYKDLVGLESIFRPYDETKAIIVMSMVSVYLKTLDLQTNDIDKTINVIESELSGRDGNVYETISSVADRSEWTTKSLDFYPMRFPKNEQCSDFWKLYKEFPEKLDELIKSQSNPLLFHQIDNKDYKEFVIHKELKETEERKDAEINMLKNSIRELKDKIKLLEDKNIKLETQHQEDEARLLSGFGLPVKVTGNNDGNAERQQIIDTDTSKALAESRKQNDMSQKQIKEMEKKIKELQDKLGKKTIPLSSLADGIKRYAEFYGLQRGKDLLISLSYLLKKEHVWTDNVESLENFFIEAEKENKKPSLTLENNEGGNIIITGS